MFKLFCTLMFAVVSHAENVILISDIHFDPFADRSLVSKLIAQPESKWESIFASSTRKEMSEFRADTNYPLWQSTLKGLKEYGKNPSLVIVAGDFFRHTFRAEFAKIYNERKGKAAQFDETYAQFQQKTIQFLLRGLTKTFPEAQFLPVIGNNESTCGDYMVFLNDPFLTTFAKSWQAASKKSIPSDALTGFASSGHYTTTFNKIRLIVANDIFMAPQYNGRCGNSMVPPAQGELAWIDEQLTAAEKANEKVWLISHIPPGIDLIRTMFKSLTTNEQKIWTMMKENDAEKYLEILHRHSKAIQFHFTGHNHFADFRLPQGEVAIMMIPSISPNATNNPAFQILDFDPKESKVKDLSQYSLNLEEKPSKWTKLLEFNKAFEQKEVSLESLKAIATSLNDGQLVEAYTQYSTSNGGMPSLVRAAIRAYLCGMHEMTAASYETCIRPKKN